MTSEKWNFEAGESHVFVCRNDHSKGDCCNFEQMHPVALVALLNEYRTRALKLERLSALNNAALREDVLNAAVDLLKHWDGPALADVHPYAYYVNRLRLAVEKALRARA